MTIETAKIIFLILLMVPIVGLCYDLIKRFVKVAYPVTAKRSVDKNTNRSADRGRRRHG